MKSNVQTRAVDDVSNHPLKFYYDFGVRVTINTDNRLVTNTSMTDELLLAVETFNFSPADVKQLLVNGFKSAFLPFHERQATLRRVSREIDLLLDGGSPDEAKVQTHGSSLLEASL